MAYKGHQCKHKECQYNRGLVSSCQEYVRICHYCHDTGHSRGCDAIDCTHYLDPKVERKREDIRFGSVFQDGEKYEWVSAQLKVGGMR